MRTAIHRCSECDAILVPGEHDTCASCEAQSGVYFAGGLIAVLILIGAIALIWYAGSQAQPKEALNPERGTDTYTEMFEASLDAGGEGP